MQKFIIGTDNFDVGEITYKIDKKNAIINDLTIIGNQEVYEELSENEDGEWNDRFITDKKQLYSHEKQ